MVYCGTSAKKNIWKKKKKRNLEAPLLPRLCCKKNIWKNPIWKPPRFSASSHVSDVVEVMRGRTNN